MKKTIRKKPVKAKESVEYRLLFNYAKSMNRLESLWKNERFRSMPSERWRHDEIKAEVTAARKAIQTFIGPTEPEKCPCCGRCNCCGK